MNSYQEITANFGLVWHKRWKIDTSSDLPDINYGRLIYAATLAGRMDHVKIFTAMQTSVEKNTYCDKNFVPGEWNRKRKDAKQIRAMIKESVAGMDQWVVGKHTDDYFATIDRKIRNIITSMLVHVVVKSTGSTHIRETYLCGTPYCCDLDALYAGECESAITMAPSFMRVSRNSTIQCRWERFDKYFVRREVNTLANRIIVENSHNRLTWHDDNIDGVSDCFCTKEATSRTTHYHDRCDFVHRMDFKPMSDLDERLTEFQQHLYKFMINQVHAWCKQYFPQTVKSPKQKFLKGPTGRDAPDLFPE